MAKKQIKAFFKDLTAAARQGDAREESFYSSLETFLEKSAALMGLADIRVTTLPRPTEAGNPDFRVWNGTDRIVGYLEAKPPTESNLDRIENSEQLKRYRETFPNLILTNFFEFRLYRDGNLIDTVQAGRPFVLTELKHEPPVEKADELAELLETFFEFSLPKAYTAEELAMALARRTRFLRDIVRHQLEQEQQAGTGDLVSFYKAFHDYLISNLTTDSFSDLYAQTITYGLFAARTRSQGEFNRRTAYENIPHTIGILRDVFRFISLEDPPTELEWVVDDIAEVLAVAEVGEILARYYEEGKGSDPIVHFYETFLAEYDPEQRERRGVYYTPEPVVSYIVRSVHELLKEKFDRPDGLADRNVTLLDPAAGTMTFVAKAAQVAVDEFKEKYGEGGVAQFIQDHILKNFYAFELMMAPYAVGHMKMAFFLEELGYTMTEDDRFQFYLTNTLEMEELEQSELTGMKSLSEESKLAAEVKKDKPILVILGNPPYSGISANMDEWITGLIEDYKYVDGEHFGERKHWLHDDYVKFLRFAQWKIEQTGQGIVAMITNHGYLDNPTFRGMRWNLLSKFGVINIVDIHGNSLRSEVSPDGSSDENVFDIRQGVAIALMSKRGPGQTKDKCRSYSANLWGTRKLKYEWLSSNSWSTTDWEESEPTHPFYLLSATQSAGDDLYETFLSIIDIFPAHVSGFITSRDRFVVSFDREQLKRRMRVFLDESVPDEVIRDAFSISDTRGWNLSTHRAEMRSVENWEEYIIQCLYRPFDKRWIIYHPYMVDWPRTDVLYNMLEGENLALISARSNKSEYVDHFFCTDTIPEAKSGESTTQSYSFPLFKFPQPGASRDIQSKEPNISPQVFEDLRTALGTNVDPITFYQYLYAISYSETYRAKYSKHLRLDFPRFPLIDDSVLFVQIARLGEMLVQLHLLKDESLSKPLARFHGEGGMKVARTKRQGFRYEPTQERAYINEDQYFAPVPLPLWEYQIGGYQVLHKWLKDRKGRALTLDDIQTYCRIVTAIAKTIEIQEEIDALYPQVEGNLLDINLA